MSVKSSGSLSLTEIAAEFGGGSTVSLFSFYRGGAKVPNGPAANAGIPTAGAISMQSFYGAVAEMQLTLSSNTTNVNVLSLYTSSFGAPSSATVFRLTIAAGVVIGGVGQVALNVGQFPAGSTIIIDNNGSIQGYGGAANSGAGGDAIKADYPNQIVTINNKTGATIYGGGGGGGKGGTGGTGGGGSVTEYTYRGPGEYAPPKENCCRIPYGGSAVCLSGYIPLYSDFLLYAYRCEQCYTPYVNYTPGGAGGPSGNGGKGQGYNQSLSNGIAGSAGAAGGTNAGAGGTGGSGGNGGAWGANGGAGNTGGTGANGNYTAGIAGVAGTGGGAAGRYLVKGANSVTFNNTGTIAGGLA